MTNEERKQSTNDAVAEFLARGGVIQQVAPGVSGRVPGAGFSWGRKPGRPAAEDKPVEILDPEEE